MQTNENICLLSHVCKKSGTESCNDRCSAFIQLHGSSGKGGRVSTANVPKDYVLYNANNTPIRSFLPSVYNKVQSYIKTFSRQFEASQRYSEPSERIKSLYLWSESPGTGKTTCASTILNEYIIAHYIGSVKRGVQAQQRPALFVDVNRLQKWYNEFNRRGVPESIAEPAASNYYKTLKLAESTPFVVFDDIGVRNCTEPFRADLHDAINHRVTNQLPSVYTSNIPIEELEDIYDARLYDRIRDLCASIHFEGTSRRGFRK